MTSTGTNERIDKWLKPQRVAKMIVGYFRSLFEGEWQPRGVYIGVCVI